MGLIRQVAGEAAGLMTPQDDALLMHGMMCMVSADGTLDAAEKEMVEGFFCSLPEFRGKNFQTVYQQAQKVMSGYPTFQDSVRAVGLLSTPLLKRKMFVLAADLALSSGDVSETEDAMLEAMQRVLEIDDATARKIIEVLSMKYAR